MESSIDQSAFDNVDWSEFINFDSVDPSQPHTNYWDQALFEDTDLAGSTHQYDFESDIVPEVDFLNDATVVGTGADSSMQIPESAFDEIPEEHTSSLPQVSSTVDNLGSSMAVVDQATASSPVHHNNNGSKVSEPNLIAEFELALRAFQSNRKRQAPESDQEDNEKGTAFHKFRVTLPGASTNTDQSKPKMKRLKRSDLPPCLLCKFMKRKCSSDQTCARCIEKCLGQRDLAFTHCLRDHPSKFNPFLIDDPSSQAFKAEPQFYFVHLHHYLKFQYADRSISNLMLLSALSHMCFLVSSTSVFPARYAKQPEVILHFHATQSRISQHVLQRLEDALHNSTAKRGAGYRHYHFILALCLYGWLKWIDTNDQRLASSEAEVVCKQYLCEYICLLLSSTRSQILSRRINREDFFKPILTEPTYRTVDLLYDRWVVCQPRSDHEVCFHAALGCCELVQAASRVVSLPSSILIKDTMSEVQVWPLTDGPFRGDLKHTIGIWSLFWQQIPIFVRHYFSYSEAEFLMPLLHYGDGSCLATSTRPLPENLWLEWMKEAQKYRFRVHHQMLLMSEIKTLSAEDIDLLNRLTYFWDMPLATGMVIMAGTSKPSPALIGGLRLIFLVNLSLAGLIEPKSCSNLLQEVAAATEGSLYQHFPAGMGLILDLLNICIENATSRSDEPCFS